MRSQRWQDYSKLVKSPNPVEIVPQLVSSLGDLLKVANSPENQAAVLNYFAMSRYQNADLESATNCFQQAYALSQNLEALKNAVVSARQSKQLDAVHHLEKLAVEDAARQKDSTVKAELYDALCHAAGERGDDEVARKFGLMSLELKDRLADVPLPLTNRERPIFDFLKPERNIISISLYGSNPRYTRLAVENVIAAPYVFPGWTCRFYCDDKVPMPVIEELVSRGAQVRIMPLPHEQRILSGMFWRFLVAADADVDFFLIRDADCLLSVREKVCVDEWLVSEKDFHVMRDFYTHSELLLGGLWGGIGGRLSTIETAICDFQKTIGTSALGNHPHDQVFLRNHVWPAIKETILQHDSVFRGERTQNFPPYGFLQPMRHVGQDMSIYMKR